MLWSTWLMPMTRKDLLSRKKSWMLSSLMSLWLMSPFLFLETR
uniref:Uncharacterized protein n=1 Tax=Lotus japonicus TaxID=34305 RepID=I3SP44_LOTJA|nr:unknown [Lotus japonicus]